MFTEYIVLVNSLLTPPKMFDRVMKLPKTKQKSKNKTSSVYYITRAHDWLSTGSRSGSLGKKKNPSSINPKQPGHERTICLIFQLLSTHIHTALLLNAEVRKETVAPKTLQGGRERRQENEEEVKKNENI